MTKIRTTQLVLPADATKYLDGTGAWSTPAGGGGGGAATPVWTKLLTADPMTSLANWTSRSGTWTAGGTYGVNQTANDQDDWLECTTDLSSYNYRAIEATIRLTNASKIGVGFTSSGTWSTGAGAIALDASNNTIWWDRFGSGGSTASFTVAQNTDYTFRVVERVAQQKFLVFVNGTQIATITENANINTGRVGLYSRNAQGWWRNVTVWGGSDSFTLPT